MRQALTKIAGYFVELDMPDPRHEWRQMALCIGAVALIGILLVGLLLVAP